MPDTPTIILGQPFYPGNVESDSVLAVLSAQSERYKLSFIKIGGSNTAKAFNMLWAHALNEFRDGDAQYFAMLHSDCVPHGQWLQTLYDEMQANKLDLISVVSPIKNQHGLTSCGCDVSADDPWKVRRFTMREVMSLPETFDYLDTVAAGLNDGATPLLVNTGCMLIDMRNPKWQEKDADGNLRFRFTFYDRIRVDEDGDYQANSISEDWDWSRMMRSAGMRYAATRKVPMSHVGRWPYKNTTAWGDWHYDKAHPELAAKWGQIACSEDGTPLIEATTDELEAVG